MNREYVKVQNVNVLSEIWSRPFGDAAGNQELKRVSMDERRLAAEFEALVGPPRRTGRADEGLVDEAARLAGEKEELRRIIFEQRSDRPAAAPPCRPAAKRDAAASAKRRECSAAPGAQRQGAREREIGAERGVALEPSAKFSSKDQERRSAERVWAVPKFAHRADNGDSLRVWGYILVMVAVAGGGLGRWVVSKDDFFNSPSARGQAVDAAAATTGPENKISPGADSSGRETVIVSAARREAPDQTVDAPVEREAASSLRPEAGIFGVFAPRAQSQTMAIDAAATEMRSARIRPSGAFLSDGRAREDTAAVTPSAAPQTNAGAAGAAKRRAEASRVSGPASDTDASPSDKEPHSVAQLRRASAPPSSRSAAMGSSAHSAEARSAGHVTGGAEGGQIETTPNEPEERTTFSMGEPERASLQGALDSIAEIVRDQIRNATRSPSEQADPSHSAPANR